MIHFSEEVVAALSETFRCSCGFVLTSNDFGFDGIGRTMTLCPRCGPSLVTVRRGVPVNRRRAVSEPRVVGRCQCGVPLVYSGNGAVPERCPECRAVRKNEGNIARNKARRARITKRIEESAV